MEDEREINLGPAARRGRLVMSRGPIVRGLEVANVITALCAVAALIFSLIVFGSRLDILQKSRRASAADTCLLIRQLVTSATPPSRMAEATAYILSNGLQDCEAYGRRVTRLPR